MRDFIASDDEGRRRTDRAEFAETERRGWENKGDRRRVAEGADR